MRIITRGLLLLLVMLSLVSCSKTLKPEELPANIAVGDSPNYTKETIGLINVLRNVHEIS